jgi:hypothetical protein
MLEQHGAALDLREVQHAADLEVPVDGEARGGTDGANGEIAWVPNIAREHERRRWQIVSLVELESAVNALCGFVTASRSIAVKRSREPSFEFLHPLAARGVLTSDS